MPFPNTQALHPSWSTHHQPTATSTLNGRIVARGPDTEGGWDPATGPIPSTPGPVLYDGPFRAQALQDNGDPADAAGQSVTVRTYLVALRADAPALPPGTRMTVSEAPDDAELVNKVFSVTGAALASRRFERDIYADLDLSNQPEEA